MKFQAAATVFSIVLCSMKIDGVEGKIKVDNTANALDMVTEVAKKLMGVENYVNKDTIKFIGDEACSGIFSDGKQAMLHNTEYNYDELDVTELAKLRDVEAKFPNSGIILSTGAVDTMDENLRRKKNADTVFDTPGDEYLNGLLDNGETTNDACVLEFEFIAPDYAENLYFEYLFGSDEYNEYVGETYHDLFALVLNGENIAIVPNTDNTHVSIDTVNKGETGKDTGINGEYFINNERLRDAGKQNSPYQDFAPNGFTTVLQAVGKVKKGQSNKISFRIADTADTELDSWVIISAESLTFDGNPPTGSPVVSLSESPVVSLSESPVVSPTQSPTGYVKGDPHFMTWAGEKYDFHGVCDLVLVHVPTFGKGIGMDIHVRSEKMKIWSYVSSAAVRIGQDVFEVIGGSEAKFLTNGVEGKVKNTEDEISLVSSISGFPIHNTRKSGKGSGFAINIGNNEKVVISVWHLFVSVSFENPTSETFHESVGLLGSFQGGLKMARDRINIIKEVKEYGQEWQVRNSEPQLFHSTKDPQYPSECIIPSSTDMRRRLGQSELSMNEAKKACVNVHEAEMNLCIFDVLATNDKFIAGAY